MKKSIISIIISLCILFSGVGVFAADGAGGVDDPLLSLSYAENTVVPSVRERIGTMVGEAVEEYHRRLASVGTSVGGLTSAAFSSGDSITLGAGQTVILVSGNARVDIISGSVLNATVGFEAVSGKLLAGHRYIVCEDSSARISISGSSVMCYSASARSNVVSSPFEDVRPGAWYYSDVAAACSRGLVNGITPTRYEPESWLRTGQAIKLAACMHQLYYEGRVSIEQISGGQWYRPYVDYALEKGIISGEYADYNAEISRRDFISIFYNALPESCYSAINSIPDGSIPDVPASEPWAAMVYVFYRAGILTGYTNSPQYNDHDFGPDSLISRAEVATIMNRMFDSGARKSFSIS